MAYCDESAQPGVIISDRLTMSLQQPAAEPNAAQRVLLKEAPRWQDLRAKAIDATFDTDRRRVGEEGGARFRWLS